MAAIPKNVGATGVVTDTLTTTVKVPFLRSAYNYDTDLASNEASVKDFGKSMTSQAFKDEVDLNQILKRMGVVGQMPEGLVHPTFYADFDNITDFRTAQDAVLAVQDNFNLLPADVRARFSNDPQAFLEFCDDPKNMDEMVRMRLAFPPPKADNAPAVDVPPKKE